MDLPKATPQEILFAEWPDGVALSKKGRLVCGPDQAFIYDYDFLAGGGATIPAGWSRPGQPVLHQIGLEDVRIEEDFNNMRVEMGPRLGSDVGQGAGFLPGRPVEPIGDQ